MKALSRSVMFIVALIVTSSVGNSAEVTKRFDDVCRYSLEGEIQPGDHEKVIAISGKGLLLTEGNSETDVLGDEKATLCLNSAGGSFAEAIIIAKHISQTGIATVIDKGSYCLSACAVIFMAGRTYGAESDYINRRLHVEGVLGFHRPYFDLSKSNLQFSPEDVSKMTDVMLDLVTFFLSLSNEKGGFGSDIRVKPSLVHDMLQTDRDNLVIVDTVDKAGRWGIDLFGYDDVSRPMTPDKIYNACANFIAWQIDDSNDDHYEKMISGKWADPTRAVQRLPADKQPKIDGVVASYSVMPGKSGYASVSCTVNVYEYSDKTFIRICASDEFTGVTYGKCEDTDYAYDVWIPPTAVLPPSTKTVDLIER